ncbi:MAG: M14 family zinc carboxypeptidase, partial [Gemmatimonadota bacterium]|nr:M14 family zinc carboxypeptidase [Gemmatimonadota bacterium]
MPQSTDPRAHASALLSFEGPAPPAEVIGQSREGRPLHAHRIGAGPLSINLVGGCHADEPVGPRLLEKLVRYLASPRGEALRSLGRWSVIPHINPDGAAVNAPWQPGDAEAYDFVRLLEHRVRELPGDDIEFGFGAGAAALRPENTAALDFWRSGGPIDLHVSMHGMSVAAGPYFLVEEGWWPRFEPLAQGLAREVAAAGYTLHDVERLGEKGFHRLARGFCTRPDSVAMRDHFLALRDQATASRFRPSSMEAVRSFSDDPLTLVTEMPLFITPGVGETLGPPDPRLEAWKQRIAGWLARVQRSDGDPESLNAVGAEAETEGLRPMA